MVRDDLCMPVPSYFRCPISLDVMKSPVSLCTGVTYDRSSIQRWLDGGNNTCPATMQVLHTKDLIPNLTLQSLIKIWSDSVATCPTNSATVSSYKASEIIGQLESDLRAFCGNPFSQKSVVVRNLDVLTKFAEESEENGRFLVGSGGRVFALLVSIIGKVVKDLSFVEKVVVFCNVLLKNRVKIDSLIEMGNWDFKAAVVMCLKQGRLELRISVAKFLDLMASQKYSFAEPQNSLCSSWEEDEIYSEILRLITTSDWNAEAIEASLSFLTRLAIIKRNRVKMVRAGGMKVLATALEKGEIGAALTEKVLKILEMATGCKEGRIEICDSEICITAVVRKTMKVSNVATEHAVTVLWSLCCLFGEKRAVAKVAESNGMAKILLLLQSNCSPAVRQRCGDLLRVFRCSSSSKSSCVSWYDTKTTHIMPF